MTTKLIVQNKDNPPKYLTREELVPGMIVQPKSSRNVYLVMSEDVTGNMLAVRLRTDPGKELSWRACSLTTMLPRDVTYVVYKKATLLLEESTT